GPVATEVRAVEVVDDREDAAAHRDARFAVVAGVRPSLAEALDLLGLHLVERHAGVLAEQRRAHQVEALLGRPLGGGASAGAPPDALTEPGRVRLDPQQAGRV